MDSSDRIRAYQAKAIYSDFAQRQRNAGGNCSYAFSKINFQTYEQRESIKQGSAECQSCGSCSECRRACYIGPGRANPFGSLFINSQTGYLLYSNYDFEIGTQPFTIEWYQYLQTGSPFPRAFSIGNFSNTTIAISEESASSPSERAIYLWLNHRGPPSVDGSNRFLMKTISVQDRWRHMALVGNGAGAISLFTDGILQNTCNTNYNIINPVTSNPPFLGIGSDFPQFGNSSFYGYINSFRYVIGSALYTGNFVIPKEPPSLVSGTKLLLNFDTSLDNPFVDATGIINRTPIVNDATVQAVSQYVPLY